MINSKTIYTYECDFCGAETKYIPKQNRVVLKCDKDHSWYVEVAPYLGVPYVDETKRCICVDCLEKAYKKVIENIKKEISND